MTCPRSSGPGASSSGPASPSLLLAVQREARAQATTPPSSRAPTAAGMDTHLFRPAMDSKGLFTVNGDRHPRRERHQLRPGHRLRRTPCCVTPVDRQPAAHRQLASRARSSSTTASPTSSSSASTCPSTSCRARSSSTSTGSPQAVYANKWGPDKLDFQGSATSRAHAKWRITSVEHGFGLALGVQVGDGLERTRRTNAGADPGFWYWPQAHRREALRLDRASSASRVNGGYRGHSASDDHAPARATAPTTTATSSRSAAALSWRVLEPLDLVAETYGTYLLASGADSRRQAVATRPSAASSSSSSETRT